MIDLKMLGFIAIGGAIGTLFRYFALEYFRLTFPLGTVLINLSGSFLLGLLTGFVLLKKVPKHWQNGIAVGFCGSLTTMSTFAADVYNLVSHSTWSWVTLYFFSSVLGGLAFAVFGLFLGKKIGLQVKGGDGS